MGLIGRWIDQMCAREPDVMGRVYRRKFGNLVLFLEDDGKCGCLVGSAHIEGSAIPWYGGCPVWGEESYTVGLTVAQLCRARGNFRRGVKRADAFVIRALKNRIRKRLGISITETPEVEVASR